VIVIQVRISGNWYMYQIMMGSNIKLILRPKEAPMVRGDELTMESLRKLTCWPILWEGGQEDLLQDASQRHPR
jgi:hypothetical protein